MPTPYLIADAAQVTVLRSLASTAFGRYDLKPPKGIDVEELYPPSAPGNEAAYVSSLDPKRRVGGMFRRFIRADVKIQAPDGEEAVATSNVEEVLDGVADRTSGDFFLESDISQAGLGPWVPFTDFNVGDLVNVEIWGRVVRLPVVRINPKDWSVHVGGQLLSDADARLAQNADIYNAVVNDRRELAGLDVKIETSVSSARSDFSRDLNNTTQEWKKNLDSAQSEILDKLRLNREDITREYTELSDRLKKAIQDAEEANERLSSLTRALQGENQDLDNASKQVLERIEHLRSTADWVDANQGDVNKAIALALSAQGEYNEFNNIKWFKDAEWKQQQEKINNAYLLFQKAQSQTNNWNTVQFIKISEWQKQTDEMKAAQREINLANDKFKASQQEYNRINDQLQKYQNRMLKRLGQAQKQMAESQSRAVDELMATKSGANRPGASVETRGDGSWKVHLPSTSGSKMVHVSWYKKESNNDLLTLKGEKLYGNIGSFSLGPDSDYVHIRWTMSTNTVETINRTISETYVSKGVWQTILSTTASNDGKNLVLDANITWSAADRGSGYGIRLVVNGTVIGTEHTTELGPATVFGDGERGQSVDGTKTNINKGNRIELQAYCGAVLGSSRQIKFASMNGTYAT